MFEFNSSLKQLREQIEEKHLPPVIQHKKASNRHANLPLEMYSFTL